MVFIPSRKALLPCFTDFQRFYEQVLHHCAIAARKPRSSHGQEPDQPLPSPTGPPRWLSLALPLPDIDPLQALQQLGGFEQQHAYWEQPSDGLAIAAAEPCTSVQFHGEDRFVRSQTFLQNCIATTLVMDPLDFGAERDSEPFRGGRGERREAPNDLPCTGPRFYCSFTFFDQVSSEGRFPPATLFLPRWQVARRDRDGEVRCSFVAHVTLQRGVPNREDCQRLWQQYQTLQELSSGVHSGIHPDLSRLSPPFTIAGTPDAQLPAEQHFQASVQSVLKTIAQGQIHKVVLAHPQRVRLEQVRPGQVRPGHRKKHQRRGIPGETPRETHSAAYAALHSLRRRHRDCHIFSVGSGLQELGCPIFLGASPERLLRVQDRQLQTEAIAGSAPRGKTPTEDQRLANTLLANPKEQHEHRLVSRFIVEALEKLGLTPTAQPQPQVLKLAGIQHLQTPIACELPEDLHPLEVLARLHPTPAVAGVPQQLACEQIQALECFERSLYAAPIGWVDAQGNCDFCVGIRSALIEGDEAQLFAGAGIVSGSKPEQELAEIGLKLRTLLAVLTGQSSR